jgi:hypothetical protein
MAWLLRDGEVLAAAEIADAAGSRLKGLLGRDGIEGAIVLRPARSVHTFGMRFAIDVAFCGADMRVLATRTLRPQRLALPRRRARCIIEAEAGAFDRWQLHAGDQLEIKGE